MNWEEGIATAMSKTELREFTYDCMVKALN